MSVVLILLSVVLLIILLVNIQLYINCNGSGNNIHIGILYFIKITVYSTNEERFNPLSDNSTLKKTVSGSGLSKQHNLHIKKLLSMLYERKGYILQLFSKISAKIEANYSFYYLNPQITAVFYGLLSTITNSLDAIFCMLLKRNDSNIRLIPSFSEEVNKFEVKIKLTVRPFNLLIFLLKMLPMLLKYKKIIKQRECD